MSSITFTLDEKTREQIDNLARLTRKPRETVLREVVETGLKNYQTTPTKSVQALLDLAKWAEENNVISNPFKSYPKKQATNERRYAQQ